MLRQITVINSCQCLKNAIIRQMSIWKDVQMGPPDPILGVTEAYRACKNPKKVNLGVGAYRDDNNKPYVLPSVRKAEKILHSMDLNKEYLPIAGMPEFSKLACMFAIGEDSEHIKSGRAAMTQSLSGSGALRLGLEFIRYNYPGPKTIYISVPTWGNHKQISEYSGLQTKGYRYYEPKTCSLDFTGFMDAIKKMPDGSVIIFHACAHNPTGVDPSHTQWDELSVVCKQKKILCFFDMAYQGFASGDSDNDAYSLRKFIKDGNHIMLATSFAKNMGLYGERVGSLVILTESTDQTTKVMSQIKILVRSLYSSPPVNGARIVAKILEDPVLKNDWRKEFKQMSDRMKNARLALKNNLKKEGSTKNWDHITNQIGMFCFTGLQKDQVQKLIKEHHIYLTDNGRISIGGLNMKNVEYVAHCMHLVTK